jgi:hypothetical protein
MQFISEWKIREAWRIVATGHEQWEQIGSIEPEHLATVRTVQIDMAQHLARFEDGPAVLFTALSKRRQLRHIEQMASDLICLSEQRAMHGQYTYTAVISSQDFGTGKLARF